MDREPYCTRWRSKAGSRSLAAAVNHVLSEKLLREPQLNFKFPPPEYICKQNGSQQRMKSEKIVLSEMNSDLWNRAMMTLLSDINLNFFPHNLAIQKLVNYTLNSEIIDTAMVTHVFSKLLLFHSPGLAANHKYYWSILSDKYVYLESVREEENDLFWCLIEAAVTCLENKDCLIGFQCYYIPGNSIESDDKHTNLNGNLNELKVSDDICHIPYARKTYFNSLPVADQLQRVLIVLKFVSDIFEYDYMYKIKVKDNKNNRLFLSKLLWPNVNDTGVLNKKIRKLIFFHKLMANVDISYTQSIHTKLLSLTAEMIRKRDAPACPKYPFLGDYAMDFAHEISFTFVPNVKDDYGKETLTLVRRLKPDWLRMLVSSSLLTRVTGTLCTHDLTVAQEVLEAALELRKQRRDSRKRRRTSEARAPKLEVPDCHAACKLSVTNHAKRRKLLKEIGAGRAVQDEWSPLHKAALNGHVECVEELLKLGDSSVHIDTRLKGPGGCTPLMLSVARDRPNVCRMLLEHSGPILLEDVNADGLTAAELARSDRMKLLLKSFEDGDRRSETNQRFALSLKDVDLAVDACLILINSYFNTYHTLDVYKGQGRDVGVGVGDEKMCDIRWDYARYEADIDRNLDKLSDVIRKTAEISDSNSDVHAINWILDRRRHD